MTWKHFLPLLAFVVPTLVIAFAVVIPGSCIAGVNELTVGFATTIVGACIAYVMGIRLSPPGSMGTTSTGITGDQGTTR